MRISEITEAVLQPDQLEIENLASVIDMTNVEYKEFLASNNDQDDPEELADIMTSIFDSMDVPIDVMVGNPGGKAVDWYIQSAVVHGGGEIDLILDPDTIIGHWGPESFKKSVLKTLEHENIHLRQRDRMGDDKYNTLPSGYMKGLKLQKKTGKERDLIRTYLRDPQELMAHGHDLAREIQASSNPAQALRNPERFREELPVYDKHRLIFPANAKPLQRLISYASKYLKNYSQDD